MRTLNFKQVIIFLALISFMHSCAFHGGNVTNSTVISDPNFTIVGLATGSATTTHVFSIGGLDKDAIVLEAKRNMYTRYPLQAGQAYGNVVLDFKTGYYIIFRKMTCTISADIVDFNKIPKTVKAPAAMQPEKKKRTTIKGVNAQIPDTPYSIGEDVIYKEVYKMAKAAKIIDAKPSRIKIRYTNNSGNSVESTVSDKYIYKALKDSTAPFINAFHQVEDSVYFRLANTKNETVRGMIIGLNKLSAVVNYKYKGVLKTETVQVYNLRKMENKKDDLLAKNILGKWQLKSLNGEKIEEGQTEATVLFNINDMEFTGFGGCNNFFGSFTIVNEELILGDIGTTAKLCSQNTIETAFLSALNSKKFTVKRTSLKLILSNDNYSIEFSLPK